MSIHDVTYRRANAQNTWAIPRTPAFDKADVSLIGVSLALLLLTCVNIDLIHKVAVIVWLISFALVALSNAGAALGIYIGSVALYSMHYFSGVYSLFGRPDHTALFILLIVLGPLRHRSLSSFSVDRLTVLIGAFLFYGLAHGVLTGTFSNVNISGFARMFGIPLVLLFLCANGRLTVKDLWSFVVVLLVVGAYSAVVAIVWQTELRGLIFPTWITDPAVNQWFGWRSGGLLMQPAWNGLLLSLIFCMTYFAYRHWVLGYGRTLLLGLSAILLGGIFFSYSRAVYLGTTLAMGALFWGTTSRGSRTRVKRFALVSGILITLSATLLVRPAKLEERVGNEATVEWRLEIWKVALRMVPERPLLGYGFRGYEDYAVSFYEESDVLSRAELAGKPAIHNTFLHILIELGVLGFVLYIGLLLSLFQKAARTSGVYWGRSGVVWLAVFMGVFLLQGQFALAHEPTTNLAFYLTLGLFAGLTARSVAGRSAGDMRPTRSPRECASTACSLHASYASSHPECNPTQSPQ